MRIRLTHVTIKTASPVTDKHRAALGFFLEQQVKKRFQTQGVSGGIRWARKKINDGRAILTGRTAVLLRSFFYILVGKKGVQVGSSTKYAKVHQCGTKGAGGTLPTIVPKRAKFLFIPTNDRAARLGPGSDGLVFGKDFRFAKKVDIPPRPMLPDSEVERRQQVEFVGDMLDDVNPERHH